MRAAGGTVLFRLRQRLRRHFGRSGPAAPQLVMWYPAAAKIPVEPLPPGYGIRGFHTGDQASWAQLLEANGELGHWDIARVQRELDGPLVVPAQRFVTRDDLLVACAGVYDRMLAGLPAWEIGWVAAHPDHRGLHLGRQVTAAALAAAGGLQPRPVYLRTDDFRLPAVRTYLDLGFVPDCIHPSYPSRWRTVLEHMPEAHARWSATLPLTPE